MQRFTDIKPIVFYTILFVIGCFLAPNIYVWGSHDRNCWITWTNYINYFGVQNIYKLGVDYPPVVYYFLWLFGKENNSPEEVYMKIYHLKYFILFIEMISIFTVYKVLEARNIKHALFLPLLILFNIAFWYNNFLFGQMDGVHTAFAFISIIFALSKRPALSLVFLTLCINFKFQGIVFLPIVFLLILRDLKTYSLLQILKTILPSVILQVLIFVPFILSGDMEMALNAFAESVGRYPFVNMGAYNIWWLIFDDPQMLNDNLGVFGHSYHTYGIVAFFGLSGLILLPFALSSVNLFTKYLKVQLNLENALLVTVLIILIFFYFNTQMHARYSHPVILFGGTLAILRKDYIRFFLVSLAVFLNMEGGSKILKGNIGEFEVIWFQPWFVSLLFLVVIMLYSYDLLVVLKKSLKLKS